MIRQRRNRGAIDCDAWGHQNLFRISNLALAQRTSPSARQLSHSANHLDICVISGSGFVFALVDLSFVVVGRYSAARHFFQSTSTAMPKARSQSSAAKTRSSRSQPSSARACAGRSKSASAAAPKKPSGRKRPRTVSSDSPLLASC
jgi:hypothetical protein